MRKYKNLFMIVLLGIFVSSAMAFDTDFSFSPISGTKMKLHCDADIYMVINGGSEKFNGFEASILFDLNNIELKTGTVHSEFVNGNNFISGDLYNVGGAMVGGYKVGILTGVSFKIVTKSNIPSTTLSFVNKNGRDPDYGLETTDDGISLNNPDLSAKDILSNVINTTYEFVALPCNPDNKQPIIGNLVKYGTTQSVNSKNKIASGQILSFETYDWDSSKLVNYWFSGNATGNIANYVSAIGQHVDNQEGVNSGSISVKVSCPTCSGSPSNVSATLNISDWTGTTSMNELTWDSERRGYNVPFDAPFPYEVEKQVTVNISVSDNPNENGQIHTKPYSFSFNAPVHPTITRIYPSVDTFVSPSKNFAIIFNMSDDWAGINTGSIKITIPQILSGEEILLDEYIYSGSDLNFELISGGTGLGEAGSYLVSFYPKEDFPVSTEITLNVEGSDLAGTKKVLTSKFTTRPSCSFFGCIDSVNIFGPNIDQIFSGVTLVITGTNPNSPYPYFTGDNNDVLMCGDGRTGTKFGGNVPIYDNEGNLVGENSYSNSSLFITGLNIEYEDGSILVR